MSIAQRSAFGRLLAALAFAAFALRSMLPLGYMVERRDGLATVVICTSQGAREAWLDLATGRLSEAEGGTERQTKSRDDQCVFALAPIALCPASPFLPRPVVGGVACDVRPAGAPDPFAVRPPLPARGPPPAV